ncbi:hypothetical protein [Thiorhodococcus minor]|uniref:Uncharacterized protein n=1 Tax=Thiorhodococcus minor TaxID=57489 RepID=A0A6M0K5T2_9GAMM|nr:hypothetical protein [Thiorhodococcus minor]NEV63957.1 hypothetical protein [Thiorhodococcus minor]
MDHGLLLAAEQGAERLVRQAIADLARDDQEAAIQALQRSLALRRTPLAQHLLAFASLPPRDLSEVPVKTAPNEPTFDALDDLQDRDDALGEHGPTAAL